METSSKTDMIISATDRSSWWAFTVEVERRAAPMHEEDARMKFQSGLELGDIHVQRYFEAHICRQWNLNRLSKRVKLRFVGRSRSRPRRKLVARYLVVHDNCDIHVLSSRVRPTEGGVWLLMRRTADSVGMQRGRGAGLSTPATATAARMIVTNCEITCSGVQGNGHRAPSQVPQEHEQHARLPLRRPTRWRSCRRERTTPACEGTKTQTPTSTHIMLPLAPNSEDSVANRAESTRAVMASCTP